MNHIERVYFAIRLMKEGKSDGQIVKEFKQFEDFDKKTTQYHIRVIRRGRRGYGDI